MKRKTKAGNLTALSLSAILTAFSFKVRKKVPKRPAVCIFEPTDFLKIYVGIKTYGLNLMSTGRQTLQKIQS
jgi:hypothetical protein